MSKNEEIISSPVKTELLAPAGNLACALTAFDSGADAVYAGLNKFNARERTENFSVEDMGRLISYAHKVGKKVYITLNTLLKEFELSRLVEMIADLTYLKPDAVIVQDFGVLRIIREYFPELTIHASTQMGIHNSAGVSIAQDMGVERVILERQMTIKEIEEVQEKSELELEVFIHGALCCSLSGCCTFSSWQGGHSGNRGKCKQPCRRRFFGEEGNGFFFSTQDLYSLDKIADFKRIGIASLKIEGRLRQPDYVHNVVTAYRMVLDAPMGEEGKVLKQAREVLSHSLGRHWSEGFYTEKGLKSLIQHKSLGVSGALCGEVGRAGPGGFTVKVSRRIHVGDRIRIQPDSGDEGPALTITKMSMGKRDVTRATRGEECYITCDKPIPNGFVYKIGESADMMENRIARLPEFKPALKLDVKVRVYGLEFELQGLSRSFKWTKEINLEPAESRPLDEKRVVDGIAAVADSPFLLGECSVDIDGSYFLPASVLKSIRKELWNWIGETLETSEIKFGHPGLMRFYMDYQAGYKNETDEVNGYDRGFDRARDVYFVKPESKLPPQKVTIARSVYMFNKNTDEVILPFFCSEDHLDSLNRKIKACYESGMRTFRVTSLYGLELLKQYNGLTIFASNPMPITNSMAVRELEALGVVRSQAWVELEKEAIDHLVERSPLPIEIYRYGRIPLMATRAVIPAEGKVKDARGNEFVIVHDSRASFWYVYASDVLKIPKVNNTINFYDLTNASWGSRNSSTFNFDKELV